MLMVVTGLILLLSVMGFGILFLRLHTLPERIAQHPRAIAVPFDARAAAWNAALLAAAGLAERGPADLLSHAQALAS